MKTAPISVSPPDRQPIPAPPFRWGTRIVLPLIVLFAFAALFAGSTVKSLTPAAEVEAVPVVERPAIKKSVERESPDQASVIVQAAGWIEPDPFPVYATALTNGTVEEVLFLEGDAVAKGDVLARLIDDDALLELRRCEADSRAAKESWDANIELRREAAVAKAAVKETKASLELARAELEVEQALLREAERIHQRRKTLLADGTISQEEHDTAEADAHAQAARVRVVEQRIEELVAKLERMRAEQAAAERHLDLRTDERHRVELAEVALDEARLRVERLAIKAPIDGVVMSRFVEPGSMLMAHSENPEISRVAALYDPRKLQVRVDVPLADAAKIGVGQPAQIVVEVLQDRIFSGSVTRITHLADIQKNTLEVKVALDDPAPELKPDMLARVRFLAIAEPGENVAATGCLSVFAPASAIKNGTAWIVARYDGEEGFAARRTVTLTGAKEGEWHEVESGLQPGDLVITSPAPNLEPEQRVRLRKGVSN